MSETTGRDHRALLKEAFLELKEMRARLEAMEQAQSEPIAVLGMACRFPGGADEPESFWRLVREGADAVREVPASRWEADALYDPDPAAPGKISSRWGAFLDEVDAFDFGFFGIAPREVSRMDPHQRLLLEVAWEALEDAGLSARRLAGSETGVFVGISANDYTSLEFLEPSEIDSYTATGSALSIAAGRLSYQLDLRGPSVAVDTACSSSLVAAHYACQSLRARECDVALAGGVNLLLSPLSTIAATKVRFLSPDGRCKAFDARANGYVRGEGSGMVVLKRLSDARRDGDPVRAILRGSAVNQDGRSAGLTAPNLVAQQAVLRKALRAARVEPQQVGYIETHGTGTSLGDPIEMEAIKAIYGAPRPGGDACAIGAVKANIGHLEAAAGVAGLIKAVLALEHAEIPPVAHFRTLNPRISLEGTPLVVPERAEPWPAGAGPRVAAVSSFGMSGTNAHVILEEAIPAARSAPAVRPDAPCVLALSAHSPEALRALARSWSSFLRAERAAGDGLRDLCAAAALRRAQHDHRLAVVGRSAEELASQLERVARGEAGALGGARGAAGARRRGPVFVFAGQGSQWVGMGRTLRRTEPVFREALERCERALQRFVGWSLGAELEVDAERSRLHEIDVCQPALFAIEVALAALWRSFGVEPAAVVGHSRGEITAAHVAGALSLEDAAQIMCRRSGLLRRISGQGAMAVVGLPLDEARQALAPQAGRLSIAVSQSPGFTVVSGDPGALDELAAALADRNVFCRRVKVDVASHSPQIDPLREELLEALAGVRPEASLVPIWSTVTGELQPGAAFDAAYWYANVREPVLFSEAIRGLLDAGHDTFVEITPHPILTTAVEQIAQHAGRSIAALPSLQRDADEEASMLESLGALYAAGHAVDWSRIHAAPSRHVRLPAYPWQRTRLPSATLERRPRASVGPGAQGAEMRAGAASAASRSAASEPVAPSAAPDDAGGASVEAFFHELVWRPCPRAEGAARDPSSAPGRWLILADRGGVGAALGALLERRGEAIAALRPGADGALPTDEELVRVLRELAERPGPPWRGVVHLWSLDAAPPGEGSGARLLEEQRLGCGSAIQLIQGLAKVPGIGMPRLWLVTRGANRVRPDDPVALAQSALWGLGRVLAEEQPETWGGLVDLDPAAPDDEAAQQLLREIAEPDGEDHLALRGGERHALRLVRRAPAAAASAAPRVLADATYLLVGGLGGLGLAAARWLSRKGARHLVLIGRRGASDEAREVVRELAEVCANVRVIHADVADREQLARALAGVAATLPPLRGVIHAAAVVDESVGLRLTWAQLARAFAPKLAGAYHLHELTRGLPLDFFALFSSAVSLMGLLGHGAYAASNTALDALAHHRRAAGLPAISINWPIWAEVGLGARVSQTVRLPGVRPLATEEGLAALERLLAAAASDAGAAQVAVLPLDWDRFVEGLPAGRRSSLFAELGRAGAKGAQAKPELVQRIEQALPAERERVLLEHVRAEVARVLGFEPAESLDLERGFFQMGMDSLRALELKNRLQLALGRSLPSTLAFDHPTVARLAEHLGQEVLPRAPRAAEPERKATDDGARVKRLLGQIRDVSEDELRRLLAAR